MNAARLIVGIAAAAAMSLSTACGSSAPPPSAASPTETRGSAAPPVVAQLPVRRVPPGTEDATFVRALARQNITVTDDPNGAPGFGRLICAHVKANEPPVQLVNEIKSSAHIGDQDAGFVLGAAAAVYCPEDLSKLPQQ